MKESIQRMKFRIIDNLRIARLNKGLTQVKASKLLGLAKATVAAWESYRSFPRMDLFLKVCKLYDIEPSSVFSEVFVYKDKQELRMII